VILPSDKKATTGVKSVYRLFAIRPGDWAVKTTKTGFKAASVELFLKPGGL